MWAELLDRQAGRQAGVCYKHSESETNFGDDFPYLPPSSGLKDGYNYAPFH